MLTPFFELSQTDDKLFISIYAPYSNISNAEIYVDKDDFRFYSSPYFLRLHLPGHVEDSDDPRIHYNSDNRQFNVELIKSVHGEHFQDLDLIAKFLSPNKNNRIIVKPEIQILSSSGNNGGDDDDDKSSDDGSSDEWLIDQKVPTLIDNNITTNLNKSTYGFADQTNGVFTIVKDEFKEIFDVSNVEGTSSEDRRKLREATENEEFSDEHYLCDLMEPTSLLLETLQYVAVFNDNMKLSNSELDTLKNFGNKEYLLNKEDRKTAFLSLVDILFAFAYDQRTTLGESTVESAWTINKLSATLCWLQSFSDVKEVVLCCIRRSVCYPLFRHWQLSLMVLDDTINILKSGNRQVLHCLLKIHRLFNDSEPRYILNQLYITDYCIWLQRDNINNKLINLSNSIKEVMKTLQKSDVTLDIDILEIAAYSTLEDDISVNLHRVHINDNSSRDFDLTSSDTETLSSSSSSSSV